MDDKKLLISCYAAGQNPWVDIGTQLGDGALDAVLDILGQHVNENTRSLYVPGRNDLWRHLEKGVMRAEVCAKYNGNNRDELRIEYGLTLKQFKRCWSRGSRIRDHHGSGLRPKSTRAHHAR